jgi:hypothetical protein
MRPQSSAAHALEWHAEAGFPMWRGNGDSYRSLVSLPVTPAVLRSERLIVKFSDTHSSVPEPEATLL